MMPIGTKSAKMTFGVIALLAAALPVCFFATIEAFDLSGLAVYFVQMGLYLVFYVLAFWGLKRAQITLPFNRRLVLEAFALVGFGWLIYGAALHLSGAASLPSEIRSLQNIPVWKVGAEILNTWFFVGPAEELLFRGYFLAVFQRYFLKGSSRQQAVIAILLTSAIFSL